jgi:hypothetical protein
MKNTWKVFSLILITLLSSCATRNSLFMEADLMVEEGNFEGAMMALDGEERESIYPEKDLVLYNLDMGMLSLLAGKEKEAVDFLTEAERIIDDYYTKSLSGDAATLVLNDNSAPYYGEDFENIYLNIFKAVSFARAGQFDSAYVEMRRMQDKLNLLEDKYRKIAEEANDENSDGQIEAGEVKFYNSALARFIGALLYRTDGNMDSARIDMEQLDQAFENQPNIYNFAKPDLSSVLQSKEGAALNVIAFAGPGPLKKANTLRINTATNSVLVTEAKEDENGEMVLTDGLELRIYGMEPGFNLKIETPFMGKRSSAIYGVDVLVDGAKVGSLSLLERLDNTAIETFSVKEGIIKAKTIIRAGVKAVAGIITINAAEEQGGAMAKLAAQLATFGAIEASERADLRSARYFPGKAYVGDFDVPEGNHAVTVVYLDRNKQEIYRDEVGTLDLKKNGLNLIPTFSFR